MTEKEPVLCYIKNQFAYFTTQPLSKQWGDDWNDAPYEHNAGEPYKPYKEEDHWEIIVVAFKHPAYCTPDEGSYNSRYSVEMINKKNTPWLADLYNTTKGELFPIFAGTPLSEFIEKIRSTGGVAGVME